MPTLPALATKVRRFGHPLLFLALAAAGWAEADYSTPYNFTTLAGTSSIGNADGIGSTARFYRPQGVAIDAAGNVYVADSDNNTIRKYSRTGIVATLAGAAGHPGSADGPGPSARFNFPSNLVVDAGGTVYIADANNHTIRKLTPDGMVTTVAGSAGISGSDDGIGPGARFHRPEGLALDSAGNLYVADAGNHLVRKISPNGIVVTLAGSATASGSVDGLGSAARFGTPFRVAVDATGSLYVSDSTNWDIRKISPGGVVTTLCPARFGWVYGSGGAPWDTKEPLNLPTGIAVTASGRVFFADSHQHTINELGPDGVVTIVAGSGQSSWWHGSVLYYDGGSADGRGAAARFLEPEGLAADALGNLWVADTGNNSLRKVAPDAEVTTIAGLGWSGSQGAVDGTGQAARFAYPNGIAVDRAGNVYVADSNNQTLRKISPSGVVTTLAGAAGVEGQADGIGSTARFSFPAGVAADAAGNLFVADAGNFVVRKITPGGIVTTLAGLAGTYGTIDGPAASARFMFLGAIAAGPSGEIYVVDNNRLRRITPAGEVTTLNVDIGQYYDHTLGVDAEGNVYVTGGNMVRRITPTGTISTVTEFSDRFGALGVAVDPTGRIFVADSHDHTISRLLPDGTRSKIAGLAGVTGTNDGLGSDARFLDPLGIATDAAGGLYVTDGTTVRKGQPASAPLITSQPQSLTVAVGGNVQFAAVATGLPVPTYQWFCNGDPFAGATGSTLTFSNARASDAGDYTVVVTNAMGTATSNKATLTVTAAPAPTPTPTPSGGGGGGGGATSPWFALTLLVLAALRRLSARQPA